jgi:tetratricopeptide (TPR) repeat protein
VPSISASSTACLPVSAEPEYPSGVIGYLSREVEMNEMERYRMAEGFLELGKPLEALDLLSPMAEQLRDTASGQLLMGRAYYHSAQLNRAREALERAVELAPTDAYARFVLGRTLQRQNRHAEAGAHFRVAAALDPNPEFCTHRDAHAREHAAA